MSCHGPQGDERYAFATGEDMEVRLRFQASRELRRPQVSLGITDGRAGNLVLCSMLVDGDSPPSVDGDVEVTCRLRSLPLLPRVYQLWCSVRSEAAFGDLFDWQPIGAFRITDDGRFVGPAAQAHISTDGPVYVPHDWEVSRCQ
jgi:hypothetical protein